MSEKDTDTPVEAVIQPEEREAPEVQEEQEEPTLEDLSPKEEEKPTVGLDKFLEQKNKNKELKKQLDELQAQISDGASKKEVSSDIRALAEQHGVDPEFLESFADAVRERTSQAVEEKLRPLTEREERSKREQLFNTHMNNTLAEMPEYKDIVNVEVLKQLAFNPANKNKTFRNLLEETYGNVVKPRKSIETTTPRGGSKPQDIDFKKAAVDTDYFKEIMADPELKAKYNADMLSRA